MVMIPIVPRPMYIRCDQIVRPYVKPPIAQKIHVHVPAVVEKEFGQRFGAFEDNTLNVNVSVRY